MKNATPKTNKSRTRTQTEYGHKDKVNALVRNQEIITL